MISTDYFDAHNTLFVVDIATTYNQLSAGLCKGDDCDPLPHLACTGGLVPGADSAAPPSLVINTKGQKDTRPAQPRPWVDIKGWTINLLAR